MFLFYFYSVTKNNWHENTTLLANMPMLFRKAQVEFIIVFKQVYFYYKNVIDTPIFEATTTIHDPTIYTYNV